MKPSAYRRLSQKCRSMLWKYAVIGELADFERYVCTKYHLGSIDAEPIVCALRVALCKTHTGQKYFTGAKVIAFPARGSHKNGISKSGTGGNG